MKKISLAIMVLVVALASCKKTPEVNLKYVDVERDLITVGTTTATVQCDYQYIATLKKAYLYYGEGVDEVDMNTAEMRVVHNTLYVDLASLKENTTYSYYYEFHNGFNSMRTVAKTFKTEGSGTTITLPTVVTAEVTEITTSSAKSGGEVTNDGGAEVTDRGICWGINANPTLSDGHVAAGTGTGAFTAMIENLEANTTYHVRAYATNEKGTAYGLDREFVTISNGGGGGDHEWIDLGLPSGTLWATCNVGANTPEGYGDYFAWGETEPKSIYNWSTYKHCYGDSYSMTKYCNMPNYGHEGFTDNLIVLEAIDDAATTNWGNDWLMPTEAQWSELFENTTNVWTTYNGVTGQLFTSTNGASIFLPAAGNHWEGEFFNEGILAAYWSSTLEVDNPMAARYTFIDSYDCRLSADNRFGGHSIRPVRKTEIPTPPGGAPEGAINGLFTINENGDQVYFSQGNLQYQASTNTWRFAENQWDFVGSQNPFLGDAGGTIEGSDNQLVSSIYNGWIDLFGWGTSNFNHGAVCYQPWSTSHNVYDYYAYGNAALSLYEQTGEADWGFNSIWNGGNMINQWRTMSFEEWDYLFDQRNTDSGLRFAKAILNGVNGVVLFPDNWQYSGYTFADTNYHQALYSSNVIDSSLWDTIESNGAVFLPASGYRIEYSIYHISSGGYYWSSSCVNNHSFQLYFGGYELDINLYTHSSGRCACQAVRLVQDAN